MKQVVYVASPESHQIHAYTLNSAGEMHLLQVVEVAGQVQPMVASADGKHLYVGIRPHFSVVTFEIAPDGQLEQKAITAIPSAPVHLCLDKTERFLFVPSYHQGNLAVLPINQQGIAQAPIQLIEGLNKPHSSNIDWHNKQLIVPCLGEDHIRLFNLSEEGHLSEARSEELTTAINAGPRHLAFNPNGEVFYCLNELDATINVYRRMGDLYRLMQTIDIVPETFNSTRWAADIHITPDGRFLYASERSESLISVMAVSEAGDHLQPVGHYTTQTQPRGFNLDNTGNYLISCGQKSDFVSVSRIDRQTGALTELACYPIGKGAMWVTVVTK
ncbi:6-phosphogluconolactonase [Proteus mirabilis]|uniref:6-phosphogluconolactonase n=1 Tax=Proteus mirabilis TaxID=584 RepID=UPI0039B63EE8